MEIGRNFMSDETYLRLRQELSEFEIALPESDQVPGGNKDGHDNSELEGSDSQAYFDRTRLGRIREMLRIQRL